MSYLDVLLSSITHAQRATMVVAFASPSGVRELRDALETQLANPAARAHIVIAIDRQGFNSAAVVEQLLELQGRYGGRLELGLVFESSALMHAKAVLVESATGLELIVGSANLTRRALRTNYELGVHIRRPPARMVQAFENFVRGLFARPLDRASAPEILRALGKPPPQRQSTAPPPLPPKAVDELLKRVPKPPLSEAENVFIQKWIDRGQFVRQGRRNSDVLVVRLPLEGLAESGYIKRVKKAQIDTATREARTLGYVIDLLPAVERQELQKAMRKVSMLLPRLGLQLSCFGTWMPESYWPVYEDARDELLRVAAPNPEAIYEAAKRTRAELLEQGGLERSVQAIVKRLRAEAELQPRDELEVTRVLQAYARDSVEARSPELIAHTTDVRVGRQRWSPFESTEVPYKQLLVDIIQSLFITTQRTGRWPRGSRSHAARALLLAAEDRLLGDGQDPDMRAIELLEYTDLWESGLFALAEVLDRFRSIVADDFEFPIPTVEELVRSVANDPGSDSLQEDDDVI
jgi:HKD family nuclease